MNAAGTTDKIDGQPDCAARRGPNSVESLANVNRRSWSSRSVVADYRARDAVWEVERVIFERYRYALLGKRLLDLGCGAGRTTAALLKYSRDYTGVDYAPRMVAAFRKKFPQVRIENLDMRDLSLLGAAAFDFALCSFNGLDYMAHSDRLKTLREIHRVLVDSGLFVFSAHNRNFHHAGTPPRLDLKGTPAEIVRQLLSFVLDWWHYRRNRRWQVFTEEYALINDCAHHYSLVTYYIDRQHQAEQLRATGFELLETFDRKGNLLPPDTRDAHSSFLYYVARKVALPAGPVNTSGLESAS